MNIDPAIWAALAAILATAATFWNTRRQEARKDKTEPVTAMANAASTIAGAVDDIVEPLRNEMKVLRTEVAQASVNNAELTKALELRAKSEHALREEVTGLRLEVAMLRRMLSENGIALPPTLRH